MVNDASGVAILAPISTAKGAPRPRGSAGQALTSLIDEAAVAKRLGVRPAQVGRQGGRAGRAGSKALGRVPAHST